MRCMACDKVLTDSERTKLRPKSVEYEDMCKDCLKYIYHPEEYDVHEYVQESAKEGLTPAYFNRN